MNANTIVSFQGGTGRNQILSQTLASTTETAFQVQTDSGIPNTAILTVPSGGVVGASSPQDPNANAAVTGFDYGRQYGRPNGTNAPWYSTTSFDFGRPFIVRIVGTATSAAGTGNTLTVNLYNGTSLSGTKIGVIGAITAATALPIDFLLEATLQWSAATGSLSGYYSVLYNVNGTQTFTAPAHITNVSTVAAVTGLSFVGSAVWGNAAGGTTAVTEFVIDQV